MGTNHIVAGFWAALSLTFFAASCTQAPDPSSDGAIAKFFDDGPSEYLCPDEECTEEAQQGVTFSPSAFPFVAVVPDDGQDEAGGWQKASARLKFGDWRRPLSPKFWSCAVGVEMPLRTRANGRISSAAASQMAATIATDASTEVMHSRAEWLGEDFCIAFRTRMNQMFAARHPTIGARVTPR